MAELGGGERREEDAVERREWCEESVGELARCSEGYAEEERKSASSDGEEEGVVVLVILLVLLLLVFELLLLLLFLLLLFSVLLLICACALIKEGRVRCRGGKTTGHAKCRNSRTIKNANGSGK